MHGRAGPLRVVAALLLTTIAGDVAADARCDEPSSIREAALVLAASRGDAEAATDEPCASVCVPDCFCCSRSLVALSAVEPPRPGLLVIVEGAPAARNRDGILPVIDHPPLQGA